MKGSSENGNDVLLSNHPLHLSDDSKERPLKKIRHPNFDLRLRMGVFAPNNFGSENT